MTRDPFMAWRSISQSGAIILSAMHYGISWPVHKKVIVYGREQSIDYLFIISRRRRRPGDGRYCSAPRLYVCPSVRPSVCPSVRHV